MERGPLRAPQGRRAETNARPLTLPESTTPLHNCRELAKPLKDEQVARLPGHDLL
jgi:hypothetical protein